MDIKKIVFRVKDEIQLKKGYDIDSLLNVAKKQLIEIWKEYLNKNSIKFCCVEPLVKNGQFYITLPFVNVIDVRANTFSFYECNSDNLLDLELQEYYNFGEEIHFTETKAKDKSNKILIRIVRPYNDTGTLICMAMGSLKDLNKDINFKIFTQDIENLLYKSLLEFVKHQICKSE